MVNPSDEPLRRDSCEYDLDLVKQLVAEEKFHVAGTRVNHHLDRMACTTDDLIAAIQSLCPADFKCSLLYSDLKTWSDVYCVTFTMSGGATFDLYIKLRMSLSKQLVLVCSFHPEGWE